MASLIYPSGYTYLLEISISYCTFEKPFNSILSTTNDKGGLSHFRCLWKSFAILT